MYFLPFVAMAITVSTVLGNNKVKSLFHKSFKSFGLVAIKSSILVTFPDTVK